MSIDQSPCAPGILRAPLVRDARAVEHDAIRDLLLTGYRKYSPDFAPRTWNAYLADLLDLERHARDGQLVVADVDGRVVGYAAYYPDASVQGFGWPRGWAGGRGLVVHPDGRRSGVAARLLAELERRGRAARAPTFAFHTASFMRDAIGLYERLGYRRAPAFDTDIDTHFGVRSSTSNPALAYLRHLNPSDVEHQGESR